MLAVGKANALGLLLGEVNHGKVAAKLASQVLTLIVVKFAGKDGAWFFSSGSDGWEAAESYVDGGAWTTTIDWTRRQPGWSTAGFRSTPALWASVNTTAAATSSLPMRALAMPISTVHRKVEPISVTNLSGGAFLYKFPRNFVGTVEIAPLPSAENNSSLTVLLGEWLDAGNTMLASKAQY
jgi:hypothetical protein